MTSSPAAWRATVDHRHSERLARAGRRSASSRVRVERHAERPRGRQIDPDDLAILRRHDPLAAHRDTALGSRARRFARPAGRGKRGPATRDCLPGTLGEAALGSASLARATRLRLTATPPSARAPAGSPGQPGAENEAPRPVIAFPARLGKRPWAQRAWRSAAIRSRRSPRFRAQLKQPLEILERPRDHHSSTTAHLPRIAVRLQERFEDLLLHPRMRASGLPASGQVVPESDASVDLNLRLCRTAEQRDALGPEIGFQAPHCVSACAVLRLAG